MQMNICLRDLPTQKKTTLPSRVPTHAYADCKISGQQRTQLYKEFPRVHEVGHWEKNDAQMKVKFGIPDPKSVSQSFWWLLLGRGLSPLQRHKKSSGQIAIIPKP